MEWVLSSELIGVVGMPVTTRGVTKKAVTENWKKRRKQGAKGNVFEYAISSMPPALQAAVMDKLRERALESVDTLPEMVQKPVCKKSQKLGIVAAPLGLRDLDDKQLAVANARLGLVRLVLAVYNSGASDDGARTGLKAAVQFVVDRIQAGSLSDEQMGWVKVANARSGEKRQSVSFVTLYRWVRAYRAVEGEGETLRVGQLLALAQRKTKSAVGFEDVAWLGDFLKHYQNPNKPSITDAMRAMARDYALWGKEMPSYDVVARVLRRMPVIMRERGRYLGSEFKQFLPYVSRDWQALRVNDVWVGDGHSFKASVQHPEHGRAFTPEVTVIVDGCSGAVMGWSVRLSESALAVADALRDGMTKFAPPLAYYSDNGAGETAKVLDAEVTGILPRLGIEHWTGIPGNPQGRGRIERLWQTTLIPLAKTYATYKGRDADSLAVSKLSRALTSAVKAEKRGDALNDVQAAAKRALPTWGRFLADLKAVFDWYNDEHTHRSLPIDRETGKHFTPMAYYKWRLQEDGARVDLPRLTQEELDFLYRPEEVRDVKRGVVKLFNNAYFSADLAAYHGEKVRVSYDIHNADWVLVKEMSGKLICRAVFEGNRKQAFAETRLEQLADRRRDGRARLLDAKREMVELERKSATPLLEQMPDYTAIAPVHFGLDTVGRDAHPTKTAVKREKPIFNFDWEREEWEEEQKRKTG